MELTAGKLWGLRRLADSSGRFKMIAVDQRPPIIGLIKERRGGEAAPYDDVSAVKAVLTRELAAHGTAMLLDPHFAYSTAIGHLPASKGFIATLEDSLFEETAGGRKSSQIADWNVAKIKRLGADAVKVLAWYRPDASAEVRRYQQDFVAGIGEACRRYDICFVFELLVYPLAGEAHQTQDYVEHRDKHPEMVLDSLRDFVDPRFGVDLFKLESPVPAASVPDPADRDAPEVRRTQALFDEIGEIATRPWVMLSAGADKTRFQRILTFAYRSGASGYLAGRAIWWQAFQHFPDLERFAQGLRGEAAAYMAEINGLTDREATAWNSHACFAEGVRLAGAGPEFRQRYPDFAELP